MVTRGTRHRCGEEADQSQQLVALANQPHQPALAQPIAAQKLRRFLVVHLRQSASTLPQIAVAPALGLLDTSFNLKAPTAPSRFVAQRRASPIVDHVENGFLRQKHEALISFFSSCVISSSRSGCSFSSASFERRSSACSRSRSLVRPFLRFLQTLQPLLHLGQIADHQIEFNVFDVPDRIDGTTCGMASLSKARST